MKLFEKLKNALFEEEYVEVEEPKKKEKKEKPVIAKKIEPPQRKVEPVEEEIEEIEAEEEEVISDRDLLKKDPSFKFPMDFEEEDFIEEHIETPVEKVEPPKEALSSRPYQNSAPTYREHGAYEKKEEKKGFHPSPIISPIYGVLDQNYKKEDIVSKKEIRIRSSYEVNHLDFDAVREKAYGDLSSDIGLSMSVEEKPSEEETSSTQEDNLLFDMRDDDTTPIVEKVTVGDAEEYYQDLGLEYNVDYKDASKEKATGRRSTKVRKEQEEVKEEEPEETKEEVPQEEEKKLEDNLFDLIDSMYDEEG